jgi:hypothetical protein
MTEERGETFNFEDLAGFIIINLISRFIGLLMRIILLLVALVCLLVLGVGIVVTYVAWTIAPILLLGLFYYGLRLIIFGTL